MKKIAGFNVLFLLLSLFALSCGKALPSLENVNLKQWSEDRNGCSGSRAKMTDAFKVQKDKLLGLSEQQVITLLSRPDQNELYKRNQKFYYYFLQPSESCASHRADHALQLVIRFNAMGIAKEISVE